MDAGKKLGINLTVTSYLLAMSDPTQYAFCKPNVYKAAAKALLSTDVDGNSPARLVHTTEFYKSCLKLFQERYHLPFSDLQHVHIAFYVMAKPYEGYPGWDDLDADAPLVPPSRSSSPMLDLNVILYGPPGTGKTYDTIRRAVEICDGQASPDRSQLVKRFDELRKESRLGFVTFHQAYGYEDFIEGLRPVLEDDEPSASTDTTKEIRYECRPGIFKRLCELAKVGTSAKTGGVNVDWENTTVWKMSLGDTYDPEQATIYEECLKDGVIRLGYGSDVDFSDCESRAAILKKLQAKYPKTGPQDYDVTAVDSLKVGMKEGDLVIISDGNQKFRAIARINGPYRFLSDKETYRQAREVEWIARFKESLPRDTIYNKNLSQMTIYRLRDDELRREALGQLVSPTASVTRNYVLIIDEINRGNISKILGELITLLEPDKRLGAENELQVTLPYSGRPFGVPQNLFVIGTMNTADRSIAFLDVALRRRFKFVEMMPEYPVLREHWKKQPGANSVDLAQLLEVINARIELLYDRDHQIGHSFFLGVKSLLDLRDAFCGKVIPLLQEYFYGDWAKVCLVLGCPANSESSVPQANPNPIVVARSLKKISLLSESDEFDDKLSFSINSVFADAKDPDEVKPFLTAVLKPAKAT